MSSDATSDQLSAALRRLYDERDAALEAAVEEGYSLLKVATLLDDVPEGLLVPNQVASIVAALSIEDQDEQVDVSARVTGMFERLQRSDANAA